MQKLTGNDWNKYINDRLEYYITISKKYIEIGYNERVHIIPFQTWMDDFRTGIHEFIKTELTDLFEILRKMAIDENTLLDNYYSELDKLLRLIEG